MGKELIFPGIKTGYYRQWIHAVQKYGERASVKQQIDYWEKITQEYQKAKRTKPGSGSNRVPVEHFEVIAGSETALLSEAAMVYHTDAKGLLITALAAGWRKRRNFNTIFIGIFEENRDLGDSTLDLSRTSRKL